MNKSADQIEREVEQTRGDLDRTVEALKSKMSPGQLLDEAMSAFGGGAGGQMFANLGTQVRDNPLPVALIGAGVAWLMMGQGSRGSGAGSLREDRSFSPNAPSMGAEAYRVDPTYGEQGAEGRVGGPQGAGEAHGLVDKASDMASNIGEQAKAGASKVADAAASAKEAVTSRVSDALHGASAAGHQAADYGRQVQDTLATLFRNEPLIVGALGLTVGIAVGAALPATSLENKYVGELRDKVVDKGKEVAQQGLDAAKDLASASVGALKGEDGPSPAEKLHEITEAAKEQLGASAPN